MKKFFIFISCFIFFSSVSASNKFKVKLDKCVDGDTAKFIIDGEVKTVRFLSVNTPEIAHGGNEGEVYGDEASEYTCNLLSNAKSIKLQYDPKSDETDKYGRVLAWVFVDDELLQEKLISDGMAEVKYVYDDYMYTADLKKLEVNAKNNKIGMWAVGVVSDSSNSLLSNHQILIYIISIISIVIVCIFGKNSSSKKKAIKQIKKLSKF